MAKKKKKVKKLKIRLLPCLILLVVLIFVVSLGYALYNIPVKNIFIYDNNLLSDQEIIDLSGIGDYPAYYKYSTSTIEKKIEENSLVESVSVKRSFFHVIKIYVTEYKVLMYNYDSNTYILSNGEEIDSSLVEDTGYPTLLNYVSDSVYDKFITKMNALDDNIINQISEIKYDPSDYDETRFLLTMNDGNYVYINTSNFTSLNLYNEIYPNFDGHIGILYLDSGYGEASEYKILD